MVDQSRHVILQSAITVSYYRKESDRYMAHRQLFAPSEFSGDPEHLSLSPLQFTRFTSLMYQGISPGKRTGLRHCKGENVGESLA